MQEDREGLGNKSMIATFTGASGSGKTTVVKKLLEKHPDWSYLTSLTTREQREFDVSGEHQYGVSREKLQTQMENRELLWLVEAHDNLFAISKETVDQAKRGSGIKLSILKPECIPILKEYAPEYVLSFYIVSPKEQVLRKRLEERGEHSNEEIEQRIAECKKWDEQAKNSGVSYIWITNDSTVEELMGQVEEQLK
ncbi:MAG: hypothetical protein QF775_01215 [archaeon]|nr:hypothetical protein [archaeon]